MGISTWNLAIWVFHPGFTPMGPYSLWDGYPSLYPTPFIKSKATKGTYERK